MKKVKNIWLNGFFRAWEMLFYVPLDKYCSGFLTLDKRNCRGVHVLCGFLTSSFLFGTLLAFAAWLLCAVLGRVPGAIACAIGILAILLWSDRCAGVTLLANMISKRIQGKRLGDIILSQKGQPESLEPGIGSAVFSVLILLKVVIFYCIFATRNFYLLPIIMLSAAFTEAFVLNANTGKAAFFGFGDVQERNLFYLTAILLLLIGVKFKLMTALAFIGGIILWNYWLKESFIKLAYGKSDESITFYGETAAMISSLIALIYCAGALQA